MSAPLLIVPGIGDSGPDHWQSLWEATEPLAVRIEVDSWNEPVCEVWVDAIDLQVRRTKKPPVVVAHSLGCLAFVHWAARRRGQVHGALLVAVPDPLGPGFPGVVQGFTPLPLVALSCESVVVSSLDDPYGSPQFAKACADAWRSQFVSVGALGHINSASNLGRWPAGLQLLEQLRRTRRPGRHSQPS